VVILYIVFREFILQETSNAVIAETQMIGEASVTPLIQSGFTDAWTMKHHTLTRRSAAVEY
jgi:hypothetical protein